jgi:hypothetical protein
MSDRSLPSPTERRWLLDDWERDVDIELLCEDYGLSKAAVYEIIREELGINNNNTKGGK